MSKIKFTINESNCLGQLLNIRHGIYSQSGAPVRYLTAAERSRQSILSGQERLLTSFQKVLCRGCVNEAKDELYQHIQAKNALDLFDLDVSERKCMEMIDMAKDILQKLGCEKKTRFPTYDYSFRYRDCLQAIEKLKAADTICVSQVQNNVYKLNFVYNGVEQFQWEMNYSLEFSDIKLYPIKEGEAREFRKKYSTVTGRADAAVMVGRTNCRWYPENTLTFFKKLLN